MDHTALSRVLRERAMKMLAIDGEPLTLGELMDNSELLLVLARLVEGKSLLQAFGAPGDWGYNTPIGSALAYIPATEEKAGK